MTEAKTEKKAVAIQVYGRNSRRRRVCLRDMVVFYGRRPKVEASEPSTPLRCCPNYVALVSEDLNPDWMRRNDTEEFFDRRREVMVREMVWPIGFELDARAWIMSQRLQTSEYPLWAILVRNDMEAATKLMSSVARYRADIMRHEYKFKGKHVFYF